MSENEKKVPKRRFREFENAEGWEQRKLGNIVDIRSGKDYKHLSEGKIPVYGTGGYMLSVNEALSYKEDAIGIGRKGTIDKPYILRAPFWTVDTLFYGIPETNNDIDFIYDIFQNINWKQKDESTGVPSLSKTAINDVDVLVPEYKEQKKIGNFFQNIDNLITIHHRKLEKMKALKKAYLKDMFPAEGERKPKLRFAGFTDDWEQRKFSDYYKICSGYAFKYQDYTEDGVAIVNGESIQHGKVDSTKFNYLPASFKSEYANFILKEGDIVVGLNRPITDGKLKIARIPNHLDDSLLYQRAGKIKYINDVSADFSFVLLEKEILKHTLKEAVGSDQPFISTSKLEKWKVLLPKSRDEQYKIGMYFKSLDNLITLHQRKLEKLQNIKKAYLNEMFI